MDPYLQMKLQCCGQCNIPTAQGDRLVRASLTRRAKGLLSTVHRNKEAPSLFLLSVPASLCRSLRSGELGHAGEGKVAVSFTQCVEGVSDGVLVPCPDSSAFTL